MTEWREISLGSVCDIYDGPHATPQKLEQGFVFLGISSLGLDGRIDSTHFEYISEESFRRWTKRILPQTNDIVFSYETKLGVAAMIPAGLVCCLGRRMGLLRPKQNIHSRFLLYAYLAPEFQKTLYERTIHGSTVDRIPLKDLADFPIFAPPLPEQKAIAAVLSSLDDKIDLLHRQNKTLEAMAETLFRQWFVEEAEIYWIEKELKDILEFVVDNRGRTAPTSETGIPLIATNCIKNSNIFPIYEKVRYVSEETYNNWFRAHPSPGDLIFVNKGTPGCVNLTPNPVNFCIAQDMIALRVNKNYISNYYLFLFLRSEDIQNQIINSSVGTTIPHLKKTDLLSFKVLIPDDHKLMEFNGIVEHLFFKMNTNSKQIRTLETLRDTLLPKLMSGAVRVAV